jgi:ribosomal protein S18 acetylase RimI-like enzyme
MLKELSIEKFLLSENTFFRKDISFQSELRELILKDFPPHAVEYMNGDQNSSTLYVLIFKNKVIGCALLTPLREYDIHFDGYVICNFCIHIDHRRKGYGEYFLRNIIGEDCKSQDSLLYVLAVENYNLPAKKLYKKVGFNRSLDSSYSKIYGNEVSFQYMSMFI